MIVLGLTGGIGMGKSATAELFRARGIPVWDADAAVQKLYDGGAAVEPIRQAFPNAVNEDAVDRAELRQVVEDPVNLRIIEEIVHPLVADDRKAFLSTAKEPVVLLDIPLLFETDAEDMVDKIIVVSVPPDVQRKRVMERGTMTEAQFEVIRGKQMPDEEKRARADFVIETLTPEAAVRQVDEILAELENA